MMSGPKASFFQGLLSFVFLPYQAYLMLNAIIITLTRILITKKNMLEWVTSFENEKTQKNSLKNYILKMVLLPIVIYLPKLPSKHQK